MMKFKDFVNEELITFGKTAYPKFNQIVILAGGAGSGKGFIQDTLLGIQGKVFDVDKIKKMSQNSDTIVSSIKDKYNIDISNLDMTNPENVKLLHELLSDKNLTVKFERKTLQHLNQVDQRRLPNLIFDVTLKDKSKLTTISDKVKALGYKTEDIHIVWIVNDIEVAKKNNLTRDRVVPEDILLDTHFGSFKSMRSIINGQKVMDGDIWVVFNKRGEDARKVTYKSQDGEKNYYIPNQYYKIKEKGKKSTEFDSLPKKIANKINDYIIKHDSIMDNEF